MGTLFDELDNAWNTGFSSDDETQVLVSPFIEFGDFLRFWAPLNKLTSYQQLHELADELSRAKRQD